MNALGAATSTSAPAAPQSGCSITSLLQGMADRVFGPKLQPDDPTPPIDRDLELQPHVVQWPPAAPAAPEASPQDSTGTPAPALPQGAVPCSSVLDPSPTSGDPLACVVKNDDPLADQQLILCDKEVTVGDQSYCVPSH